MERDQFLAKAGTSLSKLSTANVEFICPLCSHTRKKNRLPCCDIRLNDNHELVLWNCKHCLQSGHFFVAPKGGKPTRKTNGPIHYYYGPDLRHFGKPKPIWEHRNGKGQWEARRGPHKVADLLYRLDDVQRAIERGEPVAVVEGEPDAESCWRLGLAATCNATGASGWNSRHSAQLAGANLIVFNDNDAPGYAYADAVCACSMQYAASVRRLDLKDYWPEIAEHQDISDWVAKGHGADDLRALIPLAVPYTGIVKATSTQLPAGTLDVSDFYGYAPEANYIFRHTGQRWPKSAVNDRLPKVGRLNASTWINRNNSVEQMTWSPGDPALIKDKLVLQSGWIEKKGATVFNLYHPPHLKLGDPRNAERWVEHVRKVYPNDAEYLIKWFAHRCQHPAIKINHALFLGGAPRIGKDTLLAPVRHTIGDWNCATASPTQMLGRFNSFLKSVILVISEARDLGEINRPQFYEHTKQIIAAPPPTLTVDEKNTHAYEIPNIVGVIITSNHKVGGIFLPENDGRHYVAWSPVSLDDFEDGYFDALWQWYEHGGHDDIAAYLMGLDVSEWNPKSPPPRTPAFYEIVAASRAPEGSEMADTLDLLGRPEVVTITDLQRFSSEDFGNWLKDRRNRRVIGAHLESAGYVLVNNDTAKDGLWKIAGRRQAVYGRTDLTVSDQHRAVAKKRDNSI